MSFILGSNSGFLLQIHSCLKIYKRVGMEYKHKKCDITFCFLSDLKEYASRVSKWGGGGISLGLADMLWLLIGYMFCLDFIYFSPMKLTHFCLYFFYKDFLKCFCQCFHALCTKKIGSSPFKNNVSYLINYIAFSGSFKALNQSKSRQSC